VSLYRAAKDQIASALPDGTGYVVGFAVSWRAPNGTSPDATKPLTLTITDPDLEPGQMVYVMTPGGLRAAGPPTAKTEITDGRAVITFVSDPAFVITKRSGLVVKGLGASHHTLRVGKHAPRLMYGGHHPRGGTVIRFNANRASTVRLRFQRMVLGHLVAAGTLVIHASEGINRLYFDGLLPRRHHPRQLRALAAGRYRVSLFARARELTPEGGALRLRLRA
jgi:hypothetical protein